ncbi:uncharacterized protein [Triticum aestivum]|uniref:uncharacterized protein n=1 Tax=Triticum aestivum TaxID=4565 RepID=UPI001D025345|nr:uncharacterized protein LOC123093662 [Triticum aestivum]
MSRWHFYKKNPLVSSDQTRAPRPPPPTEAAAALLSAAAALLLPATAAPLLPGAAAPLLSRSPAAAASCSAAAAGARLPPQAPPFLKKISDFHSYRRALLRLRRNRRRRARRRRIRTTTNNLKADEQPGVVLAVDDDGAADAAKRGRDPPVGQRQELAGLLAAPTSSRARHTAARPQLQPPLSLRRLADRRRRRVTGRREGALPALRRRGYSRPTGASRTAADLMEHLWRIKGDA